MAKKFKNAGREAETKTKTTNKKKEKKRKKEGKNTKKWPKNAIKKDFSHLHSLFYKKKKKCNPRKLRHTFFFFWPNSVNSIWPSGYCTTKLFCSELDQIKVPMEKLCETYTTIL